MHLYLDIDGVLIDADAGTCAKLVGEAITLAMRTAVQWE